VRSTETELCEVLTLNPVRPAKVLKKKLRTDSPPHHKNAHPKRNDVLRRRLSLPESVPMSLSRRLLSLTVLAVALASTAMPAAAQQGRGPQAERPMPEPPRAQHDDSVSDAVRRIERSNRGQVLSAERMQYDGRDVTRIKVVDDEGRVRVYMDDAQSNSDQQRQPPRSDDTPPPRRPDGA
jgi:hypothetical protein